jgi:hypothetical protein
MADRENRDDVAVLVPIRTTLKLKGTSDIETGQH